VYAYEAARSQAIESVRQVLGEAVDVAVTTPPPGVDADLAVPCFPLAAKLRKRPEEIARQLLANGSAGGGA